MPSQQKEPLQRDPAPALPFEDVSADLFSYAGKSFLVYTDRLSGWPAIIDYTRDTTARATIHCFRMFFRDLGVPKRLRTDGGPQFANHAFRAFLQKWGVVHDRSTPHYPQANGHAEAFVKQLKYLVMKTSPNGNIHDNDDFDRGLLELRNTPRPDGRSPSQILFGHPLRSCLPAHRRSFAPEWQKLAEDCDKKHSILQQTATKCYDAHARPLPPLKVGTQVRVQNHVTKRWDMIAEIVGVGHRRDYTIKTPSGRVYWRNRRFLRPVPPPTTSTSSASQDESGNPVKHVRFSETIKPRRSPRNHSNSV